MCQSNELWQIEKGEGRCIDRKWWTKSLGTSCCLSLETSAGPEHCVTLVIRENIHFRYNYNTCFLSFTFWMFCTRSGLRLESSSVSWGEASRISGSPRQFCQLQALLACKDASLICSTLGEWSPMLYERRPRRKQWPAKISSVCWLKLWLVSRHWSKLIWPRVAALNSSVF